MVGGSGGSSPLPIREVASHVRDSKLLAGRDLRFALGCNATYHNRADIHRGAGTQKCLRRRDITLCRVIGLVGVLVGVKPPKVSFPVMFASL